jgi:hypothetical protein
LTRREQDVGPQDQAKAAHRIKALLQPDDLDLAIRQELLTDIIAINSYESTDLVDRILGANRIAKSLNESRAQAIDDSNADLKLQDGLLFFQDKLVVPDKGTLRTELIREAHAQISTIYPRRNKTI